MDSTIVAGSGEEGGRQSDKFHAVLHTLTYLYAIRPYTHNKSFARLFPSLEIRQHIQLHRRTASVLRVLVPAVKLEIGRAKHEFRGASKVWNMTLTLDLRILSMRTAVHWELFTPPGLLAS